ncbi:MAG TPA: phenylalanine--tRNA ligase subunit alpha, partial [Kiloniellales bacterium]
MLGKDLGRLRDDLLAAIGAANDVAALEAARIRALGKKGEVTGLMKALGSLGPDERKAAGQALNKVKDAIAAAIEARQVELAEV